MLDSLKTHIAWVCELQDLLSNWIWLKDWNIFYRLNMSRIITGFSLSIHFEPSFGCSNFLLIFASNCLKLLKLLLLITLRQDMKMESPGCVIECIKLNTRKYKFFCLQTINNKQKGEQKPNKLTKYFDNFLSTFCR